MGVNRKCCVAGLTGMRRGRLAGTRGTEGGNCRGGNWAGDDGGGETGSSFAAPV